jgi:adenosylcobyric acid synthase
VNGLAHPFVVTSDAGRTTDGLVSADGCVVGTYLHGLLENGPLRRAMIERLAARAGRRIPAVAELAGVDDVLDRLADSVRDHLDMAAIAAMVGLEVPR